MSILGFFLGGGVVVFVFVVIVVVLDRWKVQGIQSAPTSQAVKSFLQSYCSRRPIHFCLASLSLCLIALRRPFMLIQT